MKNNLNSKIIFVQRKVTRTYFLQFFNDFFSKFDPHNDGPRGYFWGEILGVIFFCSDSFLKGFL